MEIISSGNTETRRGPEEWFTGSVFLETASVPAPGAGFFRVFFEPGARTNWHTHAEGQFLYVVTGTGRVGTENGPVIEVGPGDLIYFAPDERHWHGAGDVHGSRRHHPSPEHPGRHRLAGARHGRGVWAIEDDAFLLWRLPGLSGGAF